MDLRRVSIEDISAEEFRDKYLHRGVPVLVTGVNKVEPWCHCNALHNYQTLAEDAEISAVPSEVTQQTAFDFNTGHDYKEEMTGGEAVLHLKSRETSVESSDHVLYAKIALNGCPNVLSRFKLETFLTKETDMEPVDHPMLLAPGKFFYWVFVGETGTFSKTHVDVMCSDAWLVVVSGRKEWVMVHPLDKHLVMDASGTFANLFDIDHEKFPQAHRARLVKFEQAPGDAIFVPSDAPHAVRNLEQSVSFTYNFFDRSTSAQSKWKRMVDRVMVGEGSSPKQVTMDLLVFNREAKKRVMLRALLDYLASPPTTELAVRRGLSAIHTGFAPYGKFLNDDRTNGIPIGYDVCLPDDRVVYYYEVLDANDWEGLFPGTEESPFAVEKIERMCEVEPSVLFPTCTSHFGPIPAFPPLSVLLGQHRGATSFNMSSLASVVKTGASLNPECQLNPLWMWHYSRFHFKPKSSSQWCGSYLFYSSSQFDGPMSLHPLDKDKTLLSKSPVDGVSEAFTPNFVHLSWDLNELMNGEQLGVINLGDDLVPEVTRRIVMHPNFAAFTAACKAHGLGFTIDELLESGLEKVLSLVLWFLTTPSVVGFTYSHTFSTVAEPHTLCLTASAASHLLVPSFPTYKKDEDAEDDEPCEEDFLTAKESGRIAAKCMTEFCNAAASRRPLAGLTALMMKHDVPQPILRHWLGIKDADAVAEQSDEAEKMAERVKTMLDMLLE